MSDSFLTSYGAGFSPNETNNRIVFSNWKSPNDCVNVTRALIFCNIHYQQTLPWAVVPAGQTVVEEEELDDELDDEPEEVEEVEEVFGGV